MYVLIVSPPIPRLLYWSENCVEVRGQQEVDHPLPTTPPPTQGQGQLEVGYPWGSRDILCEEEPTAAAVLTNPPVSDNSRSTNKSNEARKRMGVDYLADVSRPVVTMCASKKLLMITTSICACASFAFLCIAVGTGHWINMTEMVLTINGTFVKLKTFTGLWRRCFVDERMAPPVLRNCQSIEYWNSVDTEFMGPTEQIIVSMRRCVMFPILGLLILLGGQIVCFMGHCNYRKKILTFVAGIIYVVGGLCTLVGIILFIGAITEESGNTAKAKGTDEPKFSYQYGFSFVLTVGSFVGSELTGVLSVYLYISRHKHAYKKKQERVILNDNRSLTNSRSNFHGSRSLSRDRSHDNSPSHSDTYYTYTPVSESSKDMSNYTFPRDPSRYTLPDTRASRGSYPHAQSSHSMHESTEGHYASRREMDHYSSRRELENSRNNKDMDTYSRRTTPV